MLTGPRYLFSVDGNILTPTALVRGPWDHGLQHGGAVCGALGWAAKSALTATEDGSRFLLCRLTAEILRPVPAVPLRYQTSIDRNGRRSRVVSASLWDGDRCVARTSTQWARPRQPVPEVAAEHQAYDPAVPLRPAEATDPGASDPGYPRPGFNCDVFEYRCLAGSTEDPGPGVIWVRMTKQLMAARPTDTVDFLATVADLGNAVGWDLSPAGQPMVNADVTLQLLRYPTAEWVCLQSHSRNGGSGIGMMDTTLWDGDGRFGRVLSTTMESVLPLSLNLPGRAGDRA